MAVKSFIQTVDGEVVTLRFKAVSDGAMTRMINELQYELGKLSRRLIKLQAEKDSISAKIGAAEKEQTIIKRKLGVFSSDEFKKWLDEQKREIERRKQEETVAFARADDFLRRHVGDKVYAQLVKKGEIVFNGGKSGVFKINQFGQVYRSRDGEFHPVCVIRPKLPIPDQILAILTTLREDPTRILRTQAGR